MQIFVGTCRASVDMPVRADWAQLFLTNQWLITPGFVSPTLSRALISSTSQTTETENIRPVGGNTLATIKYASRHAVAAFSSNLVDIKVLRSDTARHQLSTRKKRGNAKTGKSSPTLYLGLSHSDRDRMFGNKV